MKVLVHVPVEQYGFVSAEFDSTEGRNANEVYFAIKDMFTPKEGLDQKKYDEFICRQLMGDPNHIDDYQLMSPAQQGTVQIIKRALKRIKAKQGKEEGVTEE